MTKGFTDSKKFLNSLKILVFISLLVGSFPELFANTVQQQASLRCLSVDEGLSSSLVYKLEYDHDGYLWVTTANGLNRYDGYGFTTFNHDADDPGSLAGSKILSTLVDNQGRIWAGGVQLNRFDDRKQTFERFDVSGKGYINTIFQDDNDQIWIGGDRFGLRQIDAQTGELKQTFLDQGKQDNTPDINTISKIIGDNETLWLATDMGILRFNITSKTFSSFLPTENISTINDDFVRDIMKDTNDVLWATTASGLISFDSGTSVWKHYRHDPGNEHSLVTNNIWAVFEGEDGFVWVGTDKKGLDRLDPDSGVFFHYGSGENSLAIPPGAIFDIQRDVNGALWLNIFNYGICRFSMLDRKFTVYRHLLSNKSKGLSFNNLLDLHEGRDGFIWIATDGGGLNRFDPETYAFLHYRHQSGVENSLGSDSVISISEDVTGLLWLGTWGGGLNRFDPETEIFTRFTTESTGVEGLQSNNIFDSWIDAEGMIWLSVWDKGLQKFDPETETFTSYNTPNEKAEFTIANRHINFIHESRDGDLWVGGHDGLERLHRKDMRVESIQLNRQNDIYDIYEGKQGTVWFATADGLVQYNSVTGERDSFGIKQGLPDSYITGIEADSAGMLWLGTRRGLSKFDPGSYQVENFGIDYGLQGWEFNRFSHLKARDGAMYFGGTQGLNHFHPEELPKNSHKPTVLITGLELFQKPVPVGETSFLKQNIRYLDELVLPYDQRDITFKFSVLDFTAPQKNRYRFQLEGFEEDWTEVGSDRQRARYTNLAPGEYVFKVLGANNDGLWNTEGASINVKIVAPWWMSDAVRFVALLVLLLMAYLFYLSRIRANVRKQKHLEFLVQQKTVELEEAGKSLELANMDLGEKVEARTLSLKKEINTRLKAEQKLLHMAMHDSLTDLPNRAWLMERLSELLKKMNADVDFRFVLLFLDGDQFKMVNDSIGHMMGDQLLVSVARRLTNNLPDGVHVSRQGGDEFIVLIENVGSIDDGIQFAEVILDKLKTPFSIGNQKVFFNVSIGIVLGAEEYTRTEELLQDADIAMYRAKENGKAGYQVFDKAMRKERQDEVQMLADLRKSIEQHTFKLVYQPIINLVDGGLKGFEALIRWNQPGNGPVGPDIFIPLAEDNGLIQEIGHWTLGEACTQFSHWIKKYTDHGDITIGVNLSAKQFTQADLLQQIDQILTDTEIDRHRLKFEITETALMDNAEQAREVLHQMKLEGIKLAIDDFGTGHSSLNYLHQFPVQYLKIDRSFVCRIETDKEAMEITKAIISLARILGMKTIAEGIETREQMEILQSCQCDFGQGYLFDRPLAAEDAELWMERKYLDEVKGSESGSRFFPKTES